MISSHRFNQVKPNKPKKKKEKKMTYSKLNILRNQPILISIQKKKLLSSKIKELISTHVLRTLNACINNVKGGVTCTLRVILISISHKYFYYYYTKTLIYHQGQSNKIESIELFLFTPFLLNLFLFYRLSMKNCQIQLLL